MADRSSMTQNYHALDNQVYDIQKKFDSTKRGDKLAVQVQKIFSTCWTLCFVIRIPGETLYLYLGRGSGVEGVWLGKTAPPSFLRAKDILLEYLRKHIKSKWISEISIDKKDRVFLIRYLGANGYDEMAFFWKGRELYFSHREDKTLFLSWKGKLSLNEPAELFDFFDEVGRKDLQEKKIASKVATIEEILVKEENKRGKPKNQKRAKKSLQRKIQKIRQDLEECLNIKSWEVFLDLELLKELKRVNVKSKKIKFEKNLNEFRKRDLVFQKIKALKQGAMILEKRLRDALQEQEKIKNVSAQKLSNSEMITPRWNKVATKKAVKVDSNITINFYETSYGRLYVGKNSHENDFLRNKIGKKEDIWFHIEDQVGAHALLQVGKGKELPSEAIQMIASMLRDTSKLEIELVPIIYTRLKYVKGLKGHRGAVTFTKEKYLTVPYLPHWQAQLKEMTQLVK